MSPKRAFITGARGFIGRALAARLRRLGIEVRGVDLQADPETGVWAGDVSAPGPWQSQMRGCDLVVHTAAVVSNAATAETSWQLNVMGTRHVLDGARAAGVSRFVHISSVRAFSDLDFPPGVDERHPVRTDGNPYVDTKVASEQVVLQAHAAGEVAVTVIRPGDVYGPGSRPWTVLPVQAIKSGRFILPARGRGVFSPIYVDTLTEGLVLAATRPEAVGQVLTMTDGIGVSCREFFGHYFRMLGRRGPICLPTELALALAAGSASAARLGQRETEANPATIRYLARRGTYSIEKARRLVDFAPAISLNEGMERTETWLRNQQLI